MLDWKILAASMVALLFISSLFVGGTGLRDVLSGVLNKVGEYLGTSPFGNIIPDGDAIPLESDGDVTIILSPDSISLTPDGKASLTSGDTVFSSFAGEIIISFVNETVELRSSDTEVAFPLSTLEIDNLALAELSLEGIPLEIKPDITTDEGDIHLKGFSGQATATSEGLELTGAIASLNLLVGDLHFELVN